MPAAPARAREFLETIGGGALLSRLRDVRSIVVTDGAPRDLKDKLAYGFATAEDYAAPRTPELIEAMRARG